MKGDKDKEKQEKRMKHNVWEMYHFHTICVKIRKNKGKERKEMDLLLDFFIFKE